MKTTDLIKLTVAFAVGAAALYLFYAKPEIELLTDTIDTEREAHETTVDSFETVIADLTGPVSLVETIDIGEAEEYMNHYRVWNSGVTARRILAYQINEGLFTAIQSQRTSPVPGQAGFRTHFALKTSFSPGDPAALNEMHMIVYPTDEEGNALSPGTDIYMTKLDDYYSRPCPPHCD